MAARGAAAALPFRKALQLSSRTPPLCSCVCWSRAAPRRPCPRSRPLWAMAGAAGRRGMAAPARRPAGCTPHRRSSASALRRTTCCTSARVWGAAPPARCSGAPLPLRPPVRLAGKLPAVCQLPLWRTSMLTTRQALRGPAGTASECAGYSTPFRGPASSAGVLCSAAPAGALQAACGSWAAPLRGQSDNPQSTREQVQRCGRARRRAVRGEGGL